MSESSIGTRIKQMIQEQHLKQNAFARRLGVSANYIYLLTSGKKTSISEPLAKLIESTYGYSAQWILTGEGNRLRKADELDCFNRENLKNAAIQKLQQMDYRQLRAVMMVIDAVEMLMEDSLEER